VFFRKLATLLICLSGLAVSSAYAQSESRIRVAAPSIDAAQSRLKDIIELSPTPVLKRQWKKLKEDVLDAFTQGVDATRPVGLDIVFRKDAMSHIARIPIDLFDDSKKGGFLQGIQGMGYTTKELAKGELYEVQEKRRPAFFLRYDAKTKYVWLATTKSDIPNPLPNPIKDLESLLELKKDIVAQIKNDAEGTSKRRENFEGLRKEFEALIKLRRNEDKNAFEMRKLALTQQLDEAERFLVESEEMLVHWKTEPMATKARGELSLTALPNTDLEKSLHEFAVKPSYFANVVLHKEPLAVGRVTFPLDQVRSKHVKEFFKLVRPTLEAEIDKREGKSESEKAAAKEASNKFLDMLDAGVALGVVDAFADAHAVSAGKNVLVSGIRATDGKAADELIKLLPKMHSEWQVKPDAQEHGGVSIHELTVPKSRMESFQKVFPGESLIYVGTSKEAVWVAAGTEAVKHLTEAIDQVAKPAPEKADPVVVSYQIQLAKLVTLMEIVEKENPIGNVAPTKEQKQRQKEIERFRNLAQQAMGGCASLMHGELRRTDNKIEGFIEMNNCVLTFIGSVIADKVKEVLQ